MELGNNMKYAIIYSEKVDEKYILDFFKKEWDILKDIDQNNWSKEIIDLHLTIRNLKDSVNLSDLQGFYVNYENLIEFMKDINNSKINFDLYKGHGHPECIINGTVFVGYGYSLKDNRKIVFYDCCDNCILDEKIIKYLENSTEDNKYLRIDEGCNNFEELCDELKKWILEIINIVE